MHRLASTVLVCGLLGGTAAAFAVTEELKLERSPVTGPRIEPKIFSPVCECETASTSVGFRMLEPEDVLVQIQNDDGDIVRTLARGYLPQGRVGFEWDGRDDAGRVLPDGTYKPRLRFADERRTIVLPNPIRIDTEPPEVEVTAVEPRMISPNRDGRGEYLYVHYRLSEPARPDLLTPGGLQIHARFARPVGALRWFGRVHGRGLPPRRYRLRLVARDLAGNLSLRAAPVVVRVRYVEVSPKRVIVHAGERITFRVETDAIPVEWRLAEARGRTRSRVLRLRAPRKPATYRLVVSIKDRSAVAIVVVSPL